MGLFRLQDNSQKSRDYAADSPSDFLCFSTPSLKPFSNRSVKYIIYIHILLGKGKLIFRDGWLLILKYDDASGSASPPEAETAALCVLVLQAAFCFRPAASLNFRSFASRGHREYPVGRRTMQAIEHIT